MIASPKTRRGTADWVRQRVERGGERLWRFEDFGGLPVTAVAQALSRLTRNGQLERLSKGIYYRPRQTRFGKSRPSPTAIQHLEMAQLMIAAKNYTTSYAKCLYVATPPEQRLPSETPPTENGMSPEDQARITREMAELRRNFRAVQDTHGENVLQLTLAVGYIKKLLNNGKIVRHLNQRHPEILAEFQKIIEAPDLDSYAQADG